MSSYLPCLGKTLMDVWLAWHLGPRMAVLLLEVWLHGRGCGVPWSQGCHTPLGRTPEWWACSVVQGLCLLRLEWALYATFQFTVDGGPMLCWSGNLFSLAALMELHIHLVMWLLCIAFTIYNIISNFPWMSLPSNFLWICCLEKCGSNCFGGARL